MTGPRHLAVFVTFIVAALMTLAGCGPKGPGSGKPVIASLSAKDWKSRVDKVDVLAEATDNRTLAKIVRALDDPHPRVRQAAVRALARRKDRSVIPYLAKAVKDADEGVRIAAVGALQFFSAGRAMSVVILRVGAGSDRERKVVSEAIAKQLQRSKPKDLAMALARLAIMVKAERANTQQDAAAALVATGAPAVGPVLATLAAAKPGSRGPWMGRLEAVLGRIGKPAVPSLIAALRNAAKKPRLARASVLPLGRVGQPAVAALLDTLDWRKPYTHPVADLASEALIRVGTSAVPEIAALLKHGRADRRLVAAELLQRIPGKAAVGNLLALLAKEKNRTLRLACVRALGRAGDVKAVKPILAALRSDKARGRKLESVQFSAYREALLALKAPGPDIVAALKDSKAQVRLVAAQVAGGLRIAGAAAVLPTLLKDRRPAVVRAAATAVGVLKVKSTFKQLRKLVYSTDWTIRARVVAALGALGNRKAGGVVHAAVKYRRSQAVNTAAMIALGKLKPKFGEKTVRKYRSKSSMVLRAAARWAWAEYNKQLTEAKTPTLCSLVAAQAAKCLAKDPDADPGVDLAALCGYGSVKRIEPLVRAYRCKGFVASLKGLAKARETERFTTYWDAANKTKRAQVGYRAGVQQGKIWRWHRNGKVEARGRLHRGRRHGLWEAFWDDGAKRARGRYVNGQPHGRWKVWHANGKLHQKGRYRYGKRQGTWSEWHPNGTLSMTLAYKGGRLHGKQVSQYATGKKSGQATYVKGKRHGPWKTWYADGAKRSQGEYAAGKRHGTWMWFHPGGKKREGGTFDRGAKTGKWTAWNAGGEVVEVCDYTAKPGPRCVTPLTADDKK